MEKNNMQFNEWNLSKEVLQTLDKLGYISPTEIQSMTVGAILDGKDVVAKSKTGSGKTLAFGIPICNQVSWEGRYPQAMVLEPTRELAEQVREELFLVGRLKRLKISALFGGFPIDKQIQTLRQKNHIVVGTPGRILDHLRKETLVLSDVQCVVIDEADLMLDMGFLEDVTTILEAVPNKVQLLLFSATLEEKIKQLTTTYMEDPVFVQIEDGELIPSTIKQVVYETKKDDKYKDFKDLLIFYNPEIAVVFCATKEMVQVLQQKLKRDGIYAMILHGDQDQKERLESIRQFSQGKSRILIATDLASRGIDFSKISHVFQYDFPTGKETYVHRIGRTGRNGAFGFAISLVAEDEMRMLQAVNQYTEQDLIPISCPEITDKQREDFTKKQKKPLKREEAKGKELQKDIFKIAIGGGRKSKIRTGDIVGAICNIDGVNGEDIGAIDVRESITYVEILHQKGSKVIGTLQCKPIKGKLRKVLKR